MTSQSSFRYRKATIFRFLNRASRSGTSNRQRVDGTSGATGWAGGLALALAIAGIVVIAWTWSRESARTVSTSPVPRANPLFWAIFFRVADRT